MDKKIFWLKICATILLIFQCFFIASAINALILSNENFTLLVASIFMNVVFGVININTLVS